MLIKLRINNQVATLSLNRPEALNALSADMRQQLTRTLIELNTDDSVRVVILTGEGRAFCAGLDLQELQQAEQAVAEEGFIGRDMLQALNDFSKPIIAAVNGYAYTGGLELLLCCDVIVASNAAKFADTHAKFGIVPAWGGSQKLPRIIGLMRAKEMSLSCLPIDAQQAYEWGLVNRVVEPERLLAECQRLAAAMVECDAGAQAIIKNLVDEGWTAAIAEGLARESQQSVAAFKPPAAKK